jgi:AraC family transcriptional regulator
MIKFNIERRYILNTLERMNEVISYIEENITEEIDYEKAAEIACCPKNQFQRFFSYITEITLSEYIRRRRLTLSAFELQQNKLKVIDIAQKYGYDSHASFTRAFRDYHGISPTKARDKGTVFNIYPKLTFQIQNFNLERGKNKVAVLGKIEFLELPAVRMIGKMVINGGDENPVPALWEKCYGEKIFEVLEGTPSVVDYDIGWMGEYNGETGKFTYIAGKLMPAGTPVPLGFEYRDIPSCLIANGYINGDFANGDVFRHSHDLTVGGIIENGYEPDYSYGWSAEVYAKDLSFEAEEGTINYFCPCKKVNNL